MHKLIVNIISKNKELNYNYHFFLIMANAILNPNMQRMHITAR